MGGVIVGAAIVIADDEADLRMIYAAALRDAGYEVWEAGDGAEAIAVISRTRPVLLILDVWMPGMNGFEVLDRLRDDPLATSMKVVMLSNLGDSDTRLEGFSLGVADYWIKGLSLAALAEYVGRLLTDQDDLASARGRRPGADG